MTKTFLANKPDDKASTRMLIEHRAGGHDGRNGENDVRGCPQCERERGDYSESSETRSAF